MNDLPTDPDTLITYLLLVVLTVFVARGANGLVNAIFDLAERDEASN